ncbi:hypothetical protein ACFUJU_07790 [Streptomyces sp. NPDC057235]|uniref:hypothetical protein n=1 Tax=Streptomyces sp. NPDC057235 TaxID=3346058 RepID=UPI003643ECBB
MSIADSKSYRVLCVGGPLDGRWRTVYGRSFDVAVPPKMAISAAMTDAVIEPFERVRYDVEVIGLFSHTLHVAFSGGQFQDSWEREKAAMRAVLRRDVVNHLEGE